MHYTGSDTETVVQERTTESEAEFAWSRAGSSFGKTALELGIRDKLTWGAEGLGIQAKQPPAKMKGT